MTGAPVWALWATNFIWDLGTYMVTVVLILIAFVALDPRGYFTIDAALGNVACYIQGPTRIRNNIRSS